MGRSCRCVDLIVQTWHNMYRSRWKKYFLQYTISDHTRPANNSLFSYDHTMNSCYVCPPLCYSYYTWLLWTVLEPRFRMLLTVSGTEYVLSLYLVRTTTGFSMSSKNCRLNTYQKEKSLSIFNCFSIIPLRDWVIVSKKLDLTKKDTFSTFVWWFIYCFCMFNNMQCNSLTHSLIHSLTHTNPVSASHT